MFLNERESKFSSAPGDRVVTTTAHFDTVHNLNLGSIAVI